MNKVEGKLCFELESSWQPIIGVDEGVVKCGGRPVYVWVAEDTHTRQFVGFWRLTHHGHGERLQTPSKAEEDTGVRVPKAREGRLRCPIVQHVM